MEYESMIFWAIQNYGIRKRLNLIPQD